MRKRKIFFLVALALALPLTAFSGGVDELCAAAGWQPGYNKKEKINCGDKPCHTHLMLLLNKNEAYVQKAKEACTKSQAAVNSLNNITQQSSFTNLQQIVLQGKTSIENLQAQNEQLLKEIPNNAMGNIAIAKELAKNQKKMRALIYAKQIEQKYKEASKGINKYTTQIANDYPKIKHSDIAQPQARALDRNGDFIKSLLVDKEKYAKAASELDNLAAQLQEKANNQGSNQTSGSSGGGFDPLSLLPLAGPLLGLMNSPETPKSGLSSPDPSETIEPLPSTSLTDTSLPSTSLTDTKPLGPADPANSSDSPLADTTNPIYADAFTGEDPVDGALPKLSSLSEGSGKLGPSGASAGAGGKGNEKTDEKRGLAAAAEDTSPGLNLGGGAGFQANGSPGAAPGGEEGPMAELLQNLESSLENPMPPHMQADTAALDPDALFVRVRACYARAARKGLVLDSLSKNRIEEADGQLD